MNLGNDEQQHKQRPKNKRKLAPDIFQNWGLVKICFVATINGPKQG